MKKSKKRKEKYYSNWKRITATTLIAALSATSVSLESLAAEPAQTAENQAKTESASDADDSVERPKELKGVTEEDAVKKENTRLPPRSRSEMVRKYLYFIRNRCGIKMSPGSSLIMIRHW